MIFTTVADNQTTVEIHVLQGERGLAAENRSLGRFDLVGVPPAPRGVPQIEVTFAIDSNGIVNVSARDLATGKEQSIEVSPAGGLSKAEIDSLIAEADKFRQEDQARRRLRQMRNQLEGLLYTNDRVFQEFGGSLEKEDREQVRSTLSRARKALNVEEESVLSEAILAVQEAAHVLAQVIMYNPMSMFGQSSRKSGGDPDDDSQQGE
jgi:molecular chaperone DnaK